MTVYELIKELTQHGADDLVQFRFRAIGTQICDSCSDWNEFIVDRAVEGWEKVSGMVRAGNNTVTIELEEVGGLDGNY